MSHKNTNILIAVPGLNCLGHKLKKEKWIGFQDKTHINLKTYNNWKIFFNKNDFKILKCHSDGLWDYPYKFNFLDFKFYKIFILLVIQIITGKLLINKFDGETLIFLLKKNI